MRNTIIHSIFCNLTWLLLLISVPLKADGNGALDRLIKLPKSKETIYHLLEKVSEQSGFLFIYDSDLIENEREVRLKDGKYTVRQAIYEITGNKQLKLRIIGNHILIYRSADPAEESPSLPSLPSDSTRYFVLEGFLVDKNTKEPIPNSSVSVTGTSIGSVANQNGGFRLIVPDSLQQSEVSFTHVGYERLILDASLLAGRHSTLTLEPRVIAIQEVIIRAPNPIRLLNEMLEKRLKNYPQESAYLTSFYREGVEWKNKFEGLTEAIFKVHKTPYLRHQLPDQVKLLKMRRISNNEINDTLVAKIKSGINACLVLDLIKNTPDFLDLANTDIYTYASSDLTVIDNRLAHVIHFEQKNHVTFPFYRGELYIDSENSALLSACFEFHPKYLSKEANLFVEKKSRELSIIPQKVTYTISYKPWNGLYYIHHIRGDLHFKVKKKKQLFGSAPLHIWFEMVTCKIDTTQVSRFPHRETTPTQTVFAETRFVYDDRFWGNFNVIPPEEKLNEAISKISIKVEETDY